jgi:hypothetical protein
MYYIKTLCKIPLFWILFGWIIIPILFAYYIVRFLLGFWQCDECEKWKWVNDEKHHMTHFNEYLTVCTACKDKMEEEQKRRREMLKPPSPPPLRKG